ncbi:MAG: roadblock/LC7 domain-containing protein [Candidatus Hermodarchaeota archaeon]
MSNSNLQNHSELFLIINDLKNTGNLDGAIFAYRDGGLIIESLGDKFKSKDLVSMCASVLESAVGIGDTIGSQKINKIIAELEEKTILIFECDDNTFLILILNRESNVSNILNRLEEIVHKMIRIY